MGAQTMRPVRANSRDSLPDHKWYIASPLIPNRNLRDRQREAMRDIDIKTLRLLVAVCDLQNIKRAAAQEHIEPSAISKRIAQRESSLGTPLLVRSRRGVQPTPAGVALLEHARTVLFTMERMASDIAAFSGGVRGHVRLVAS